MSVYEFVLILSSIIVGLGAAELFGGVARVLRGELKAGALHSLWVTLVFLLQVQWLWASWEVHDRGAWLFVDLILFIIGPIGYFMAAAMLFPAVDSGESLDVHLLNRRRPFFLLMALTTASFSAWDWFVGKEAVGYQDLFRLIAIGLYGVLAVTKHKGIQWLSSLGLVGAILWFARYFTLRVG